MTFGGTGPHPFNRNNYDFLGYEDDAMLVDQALYDHLLAEHAGELHQPRRILATAPLPTSTMRKWMQVLHRP